MYPTTLVRAGGPLYKSGLEAGKLGLMTKKKTYTGEQIRVNRDHLSIYALYWT